MSERPNAEILINSTLLPVMGIMSYRIRQNHTPYIGKVLARSGHDSLTGS